tara:strand:- start:1079 stop:1690 length:612 start_codon:yes stop_codon:yes gene_type:complete
MKIYDNFLSDNDWKTIQYTLHDSDFPWTFSQKTTPIENSNFYRNKRQFIDNNGGEADPYNTQLNHFFVDSRLQRNSVHSKILQPILNKYRCISIARIKANLQLANKEPIVSDFHHDYFYSHHSDRKEIPEPALTTLIYYVNTNNGYTEFEDGTKVASLENRLIEFPNDNPKGRHRGVSQTDTYYRAVINFNLYVSSSQIPWKN